MTQVASFNPYSYEDHLRKHYPAQADRILVEYGWKERIPRGKTLKDIILTCKRCREDFTPRSGRQKYCVNNSINENCSRKAKYEKLYKIENQKTWGYLNLKK